jgi:hypothetical protein
MLANDAATNNAKNNNGTQLFCEGFEIIESSGSLNLKY